MVHGNLRPLLDRSLPPKFAELLQRCWHQDKNMRPAFSQVVATIDELLQVRTLVYTYVYI